MKASMTQKKTRYQITQLLQTTTEQRRKAMELLKSQANEEENPDMWCLLKHVLRQLLQRLRLGK